MKAGRSITGLYLRRVAVLVGIALVSSCGGVDTPELLSRAAEAVEEGRYRAALIDLRNAVANEPENPEARYELGIVALTLGDAATAEKEMRRARELGRDKASTLLPMAQALIELRREAQALAELAEVDDPSARSEALSGLAYERLNRQNDALSAYQRSLAIDQNNEMALLGMARYSIANGDREAAEERLVRAREAHAGSSLVALDYGRFLFLTQRPEEAEAVFSEALASQSETLRIATRWDLLLSQAEVQLAQNKLDAAEQTALAMQGLQSESVLVKYVDARVAFAREDIPLANELAARVLVEAPEFNPALMLQAKIFLADSAYTQARQLLRRLIVRDPNNAEARRLLDAAQQGVAEQNDETRRAGRRMSQADFLAMVGSAKAESGDLPAAVIFWEQAVSKDPGNQDVKLELLSAYLRAGLQDKARSMIAQTRWIADFARARVAMIEIMLAVQDKDLESARERAAQAAADFPKNAPIATLQGLVELRDDPALATTFFEKALTLDPANSAAVINLASLADRTGASPGGVEILRDYLEGNPEDASVQEALSAKLLRTGDVENAVASLRAACEADPNAVTPRIELARLLIQAGDSIGAELLAREAVSLRPRLVAAHNALGVAMLAQGKTDAGAESLRQALRIDPKAVDPLRNLLRAEVATARFAQAEVTAGRLLSLEPDDVNALETRARIALGQGRLEEAEERLAAYEAAAGDDARLPALVMRGDIARTRGQGEDALAYYEQVMELSPSPSLVERMFYARQALGRGDAEQVLTDWLESNPQDNAVRLLLAQAAQLSGDMTRAAAEYERILATNPRSLVALNNLALVYVNQGDDRAVDIARRAFDLAPAFPIVQDTYGWALVNFDQLDNGLSILRDAWAAAPDNGDIAYHLAAGLVRGEQSAEAKGILEQALASLGEFESRADAERLLREL